MKGPGAGLSLETYADIGRIGPEWDALFAAAAGLQCSRAWFGANAAAALPAGAQACYVAIRDRDGPAMLVPMVAGPGRDWASLTTPYTCLFQPLLRPAAPAGLVRAAAASFGREARRRGITRLEALDLDWPGLPAFRSGLADAGLVTRTFEHFGNWHTEVGGGWAEYLQRRPGKLRETIRRRTLAAARTPGIRLEVVHDPAELGRALAAYEDVYARSWKEPEPYPGFNAALVQALAGTGALRFGLMWSGEEPIAAQYWTVTGGVATVLKLAHDDRFKPLSPGTVLTAHVIRTLIERDGIRALDFGRGDDPYKQGWTGQRRARIGLLAVNPFNLEGILLLSRHELGRIYRRWRDC
ncbi:MAG TPA: GNAT family N-acetyltransferase [Acetobacteraceae bacterium]|jgi:CelD/BcsL family acetyltransferase involved in cellulose biosynthesis|nr:GNAT family N-acetyltransferase [Acetobacteraceae bacterium]